MINSASRRLDFVPIQGALARRIGAKDKSYVLSFLFECITLKYKNNGSERLDLVAEQGAFARRLGAYINM